MVSHEVRVFGRTNGRLTGVELGGAIPLGVWRSGDRAHIYEYIYIYVYVVYNYLACKYIVNKYIVYRQIYGM